METDLEKKKKLLTTIVLFCFFLYESSTPDVLHEAAGCFEVFDVCNGVIVRHAAVCLEKVMQCFVDIVCHVFGVTGSKILQGKTQRKEKNIPADVKVGAVLQQLIDALALLDEQVLDIDLLRRIGTGERSVELDVVIALVLFELVLINKLVLAAAAKEEHIGTDLFACTDR